MSSEIKLPELGENIEGGDIVSLLVSEGDTITAGQNILELETDKAVVEVPSPDGGTVEKVHVGTGDHVSVGDVILTVGEAGSAPAKEQAATDSPKETAASAKAAAESPAKEAAPEPPAAPATPPAAEPAADASAPPAPTAPHAPSRPSTDDQPAPAGPATRRMARKLGVNLHHVSGTGRGGRITREDVEAFVRQRISRGATAGPAVGDVDVPPLPDFSQWGEIERQKMGGVRRKTAEAMSLSWRLIPHVTQYDAADITELEAARRRFEARRKDGGRGKVTVTVLAMKAAVAALKEYPQFNASIDLQNQEMILKRYYNIGIAADTEHGLLVPVVSDCDDKSIVDLAANLQDLADRARQRKLGIEEMQGATFTITNLGGIGGTGFTPIVNHPQVAILGISRSRQELILRDGNPEPRLMMPLCLSYDHRAIDGADGARFLRKIADLLSDPFGLMFEM